jgi:uncharacterized Zn finger protein
VKNGSVCDLQVEPGKVTALVCGSELYRIAIKIRPLSPDAWKAIKSQCAGQIGSLIELLQGKLSSSVMEVVTRRDGGLFPKPREIDMDCSCPDWADMCKHVAAALYGVGARLDHQPELLFKLRQVDHLELITEAAGAGAIAKSTKPRKKTIAASELADVFGVELEAAAPTSPGATVPTPARRTTIRTDKPGRGRIVEKTRPAESVAGPSKKPRRVHR